MILALIFSLAISQFLSKKQLIIKIFDLLLQETYD